MKKNLGLIFYEKKLGLNFHEINFNNLGLNFY